LAGHVSDWIGRKKVLITALTLELIAAALFLTEPSAERPPASSPMSTTTQRSATGPTTVRSAPIVLTDA
jgi:hypothetical protein